MVQVQNVVSTVLVSTLGSRVLGGQRCEVGARSVSRHGSTVRIIVLVLGQTGADDELGRLSVDINRDRDSVVATSVVERHKRSGRGESRDGLSGVSRHNDGVSNSGNDSVCKGDVELESVTMRNGCKVERGDQRLLHLVGDAQSKVDSVLVSLVGESKCGSDLLGNMQQVSRRLGHRLSRNRLARGGIVVLGRPQILGIS